MCKSMWLFIVRTVIILFRCVYLCDLCLHFINFFLTSPKVCTLIKNVLFYLQLSVVTNLSCVHICVYSQSHVTTDDQSISPSWCRGPSGSHDRILISVWHLLFCRCRAPLWREVGSVICISHLNCFSSVILLLVFASYFTSDCLWPAFFTSKRHEPSDHVVFVYIYYYLR
jgi:hypothetical protein